MSAPISGKSGKLELAGSEIADVRGWSFNPECELQEYRSSDTEGWRKVVEGNKQWSLSATIYNPDGSLDVVTLGALVTVKGTTTTGKYFEGSGRIAGTPTEIDVEGGAIVGMSIEITGDGAYTLTG